MSDQDRGDTPHELAEAPEERPLAHPLDPANQREARITAIEHLSISFSRAACAGQALADHGISPTDGEHASHAMTLASLQAYADTLAAPLGVVDVLAKIEEAIVVGRLGGNRERVLREIVRAHTVHAAIDEAR